MTRGPKADRRWEGEREEPSRVHSSSPLRLLHTAAQGSCRQSYEARPMAEFVQRLRIRSKSTGKPGMWMSHV